MLFGYAFWLILSKFTSPETVGISSSLISLATIFTTVASVGVPLGAQRFLGRMLLEKRFEDTILFVKSSFVIVSLGLVGSIFVILGSYDLIFDQFSSISVAASIILIAISTISILLRSIVIASLNTKKILLASTVSSAVKLLIVIILVSFETDVVRIIAAFSATPLLTSVLLAFDLKALLRQVHKKTLLKFNESFKSLLKASIASWIPLSIETIGAQLGTVVVLGFEGPTQAGFYFIAFQISMGILAVIWALEGTTYPALSAMTEGRRKFVWRTIKICLIILSPISFAVIFYSTNITGLFGSGYSEGAPALQILLLSVIPTTIMNAVGILAYAYGDYRSVLIIGLTTTIPRLLCYFVFVPWLGGLGAALGYTLGAIFGFIISIVISNRIKMIMPWKEITMLAVVPLLLAFILSMLRMHYLPGIVLTIVASYLIYLKLVLIERSDVSDYMQILPKCIADPLIRIANKVATKINRKY
jgi:O-antigen/teichoic acid export membrane protein